MPCSAQLRVPVRPGGAGAVACAGAVAGAAACAGAGAGGAAGGADAEVEAAGEYIGHILRIIRIKEVTEHGAVIEREYKVRYAYDESRDPNKSEVEHFAAVLRSQTSRLLNLRACNKGKACPSRRFG
jgi:hypothetical protein